MTDKYILDESNNVIPCNDLHEWGSWFEEATKTQRRVVRKERYAEGTPEEIEISTVFLGLCHRFGSGGPPLVFETMVFAKDESIEQDMERCCTWNEALAMHDRMADQYLPVRDPEDVYLTVQQREALAELTEGI